MAGASGWARAGPTTRNLLVTILFVAILAMVPDRFLSGQDSFTIGLKFN